MDSEAGIFSLATIYNPSRVLWINKLRMRVNGVWLSPMTMEKTEVPTKKPKWYSHPGGCGLSGCGRTHAVSLDEEMARSPSARWATPRASGRGTWIPIMQVFHSAKDADKARTSMSVSAATIQLVEGKVRGTGLGLFRAEENQVLDAQGWRCWKRRLTCGCVAEAVASFGDTPEALTQIQAKGKGVRAGHPLRPKVEG